MVKYEDIKLTPSDALDIYTEKYPNTTVKEIELEVKSNSYVYEVEGYDDQKIYEILIDPMDGTVLEVKEKLHQRMYKEIDKESTEKIEDLVNKTLQSAGENSRLHEWSLELEDGLLEFTVYLKLEDNKTVKYKYNLHSGELIKKK